MLISGPSSVDTRGRKCSRVTCSCSCAFDTVSSNFDSDKDDSEGVSGEESESDSSICDDDLESFDNYDPIDFDFA